MGRAVVLSVIGCFLTGIGWIILVESFFSVAGTIAAPAALQNARLRHDMALSLSLVFGSARPLDVLSIGQQYSRTSAWISVDVVILVKAAIAGLLLWLTIKTFDRSMGRVPGVGLQPGRELRRDAIRRPRRHPREIFVKMTSSVVIPVESGEYTGGHVPICFDAR